MPDWFWIVAMIVGVLAAGIKQAGKAGKNVDSFLADAGRQAARG